MLRALYIAIDQRRPSCPAHADHFSVSILYGLLAVGRPALVSVPSGYPLVECDLDLCSVAVSRIATIVTMLLTIDRLLAKQTDGAFMDVLECAVAELDALKACAIESDELFEHYVLTEAQRIIIIEVLSHPRSGMRSTREVRAALRIVSLADIVDGMPPSDK